MSVSVVGIISVIALVAVAVYIFKAKSKAPSVTPPSNPPPKTPPGGGGTFKS